MLLIQILLAMKLHFEISTEMQFVFFFLNETNITASLLMIRLKCTVANYAIEIHAP